MRVRVPIERSPSLSDLIQKIEARTAHLSVIGLGYVGLPLAVELARAGFRVTGFDVDVRKVDGINSGVSHVKDVSDAVLAAEVTSGRLSATTDFAELAHVDTINICVPTPLRKTKDPDVSYIVAAVDQIVTYLHPGQLILLESTTYPGTTDELILPRLEEKGLTVGKDFFLAFSPERVDPGNAKYKTHNIPKVVGGVTPACTRVASALYQTSIETVVPVSSTRVAEMVKLLENTYRSVNIGLVNELALLCDRMKIDVWEVIDAAATKPFGFMPFYPGPGLGGHCIPIDPFYLSWKARESGFEARFIELAGQINASMPHYVVDRVAQVLNDAGKPVKGSKLLILGVAYKPDIDDFRESPALDVITELQKRGAVVEYHDPFIPAFEHDHLKMTGVALTADRLRAADCVVVTAGHKNIDWDLVALESIAIFDTRNVFKGRRESTISRL
ncbi:MAG: nucleotide sugar dehydrogenase [Candidatus Eisenbacteria bacterium]|nr:nucleotide sugar dehydrogenase [Candidatus Eisenbacteria bacterium]